jgi:hypothetical protein
MKKLLLLLAVVLFSSNISAQVSVISQTNPTCPGMCDGAVTLSITGGTPPYNISTPGGPSTCTITTMNNITTNIVMIPNLCSCVYSFLVMDATFNVVGFVPVTISSPPPINITFSVQNVCCNGMCNGGAYAFVFGGTSPYSYSWSPSSASGATLTNACAGTYSLCVVDANGCLKCGTVNITQPAPFNVSASSAATSCSSCCNGSVSAAGSGGSPGYTYTLYPGATSNTTGAFTNLCAGVYSVCGSDAGCCFTCTGITVASGTSTSVYNAPSAGDFISIYPNPSNGKLNIRSAISLTGVSFEVVDVLGKKIESGKAEDIVKVNILNDGVYFITLRNKEGAVISRKKIIVEK